MDILYTCDDDYVWIMGISMISLFENNKDIERLTVYLLGDGIAEENKVALKNIADKYCRDIKIIDVPKLDIPPTLISTRWPSSAFTRLFSGQLLPRKIDKILYLDCDTIILGDIRPLSDVDLSGNIALGVKDCISGIYKTNIGLDKDSPYINAGVLLLDLDVLRDIDINKEIERYMAKYAHRINYADQDILNGIFKDRVGELDPKYDVMTIDAMHCYEDILKLRRPTNFYPKEVLEKAVNDPIIIHYTTNMLVVRPWFKNTDHPFAKEFKKYMDMSPWKDKGLNKMVFNSKESKVIAIISRLPKNFAYNVLGTIHSELRPRYIKLKAK